MTASEEPSQLNIENTISHNSRLHLEDVRLTSLPKAANDMILAVGAS